MTKTEYSTDTRAGRPMRLARCLRVYPRRIGLAAGAGLARLAAVTLLTESQTVADGIRSGLEVCATVVIPSLFPFMVLAGLLSLTELGDLLARPLGPVCRYLFHLPSEAGSALLMSFIGGYPVGAKTIAALLAQGRIDERTARKMLCFCINAGPAFVIGTVGTALYSSVRVGAFLLAAHLLASVLVGFFLSTGMEEAQLDPARSLRLPLGTALVRSVTGAAQSMLNICAFVVTFSAVGALLVHTGVLPRVCTFLVRRLPFRFGTAFYSALLGGMLEVTGGCISAAALGGETSFVLTAFLLSFGGLSVLFQAASAFERLPMSFGLLLFSRLANACAAACIACLLYRRFLADLPTALGYSQPVIYATPGSLLTALCLIGMCSIVLLSAVINGISTKNSGNYGKSANKMV